MASQPKRDSQKDKNSKSSQRPPKPFEPTSRAATAAKGFTKAAKSAPAKPTKATKASGAPRKAEGIPEAVSRRMVRRIALFCGIPTALGMSTFLVSYWVVSHDWLQLPTYAVLLVSLGWFGLGVLGVSYGVLSASWDEETGSWLGLSEFATNWGRMTEAWRSQKNKS
ncbi:MAG: PAM68 family protein [Synechococcales cyanobacterium C42_A2020_086]|jgi:hypothetical protein|nr:PAM68 family protein [Synechococcales cyanobacterium C42_A2020_086]